MNFYLISIFPEIFQSFISTSIIKKAIEWNQISFNFFNPRDYTNDKHKQIDDSIYWWWSWMLIKAKPVIDAVNKVLEQINWKDFLIIFLSPSETILNQKLLKNISINYNNIILVSWRYEWIDYRFEEYFINKFPNNFIKVSIWQYIMMWWEIPSMVLIESLTRLLPWVLSDSHSLVSESYSIWEEMSNLEYPQYTRPLDVYWYKVPDVLLSWNHKNIDNWRLLNSNKIDLN